MPKRRALSRLKRSVATVTLGPRLELLLIRGRSTIQMFLDGFVWSTALVIATILRYDFQLQFVHFAQFRLVIPIAILAQAASGLFLGLYRGRWRFGSFEEVLGMGVSVLFATVALYGLNAWALGRVALPRAAILIAGVFAIGGMEALRYGWRLLIETRRRPDDETARRVVLFGAGQGGAQAIAAMLRDPDSSFIPVALLDDDPRKRNLTIMGVPVVGTRNALDLAVSKYEATTLLISIPSADGSLIRTLTSAGVTAGLNVLTLPPVNALFGSAVEVQDLRAVGEADLLGRHGIQTDVDSIAQYLSGRRVLVTGAGGSIGSELCRQIIRFAPSELIMVDRDESALHALQLSIEGRALLDSPGLVLLDIRDREQVEQLFATRRPQVVFHAAALKHLTMLERYPGEAIKTNVGGTLNVLRASATCGVERFVNISTDKAADPISILGHSKRVAERLTSWYAQLTTCPFLSVRFGNVLGSRGSFLGTFHTQIANGGPVTVTSAEVTRYFMTVQEAVELTIQAGAIGKPGEVLVLDMGSPIRIDDIARTLVKRTEGDIDIVYTGLRPGEKVHETLLGSDEERNSPVHPLISHVPVPPLAPASIDAVAAHERDEAAILRRLSQYGLSKAKCRMTSVALS